MKKIPYNKFKHGQRVTCEIMGNTINGKIAIGNKYVYLCSDCEELDSEELSNFGYKFSWSFLAIGDTYDSDKNTITNLKFLPRTLDDLDEGDVLVHQYGGARKILGKCGEVYFLSEHDDFSFFDVTMTMSDIKFHNYTLKQEESEQEITELTLEDVAKLANVPVEKLRIKD